MTMIYARDEARIATPIGMIHITGDDRRITAIHIGAEGPRAIPAAAPVRQAAEQLEQWFAGERQGFDLPLAPATTPRGMVLRAGLVAVGYGTTLPYGALAERLKSSPRAIGQLCSRNRFPIVVPCHRVLSATGPERYSAGDGPATKAWLIAFERRNLGE